MKNLLAALMAMMLLLALTALAEQGEPATPDAVDLAGVLDALGDEVYRTTYAALLAGETVEKGSKGDAARGVQQALVALGQDIAVDGSVGPKTIAALNALQAAFGLEATEAVDAAAYAALLPRLLIAADPGAAESLLPDQMGEGAFNYARACVCFAQGKFASAKYWFQQSEYGDWEARAEACAQPWPKNGVLYKNPDVKGSNTELVVDFYTNPDTAMLVKIYTEDGETLARTLFIGGTGSATVSLPAGTYMIKDGTGKNWYGAEETFGDEGSYEIMTFDDDTQLVELMKNYRSTITVNVQEANPDADYVGSEEENWRDF